LIGRQEIENSFRINLGTALATLCQRIADDAGRYGEAAADDAAKLKLQWVDLQRLPAASLKQQKEVERKLSQLKQSNFPNFAKNGIRQQTPYAQAKTESGARLNPPDFLGLADQKHSANRGVHVLNG
jgi:hypothetical protein